MVGLSRMLLGFTLAPMPLFLLLCGLALWVGNMSGATEQAISIALLALVTHGLTLVFGLPAHIILDRLGKRRLWHYLVAALALPIVVIVGLFLVAVGQTMTRGAVGMETSALVVAMLIVPCVEVTAGLFWLIVIWRTPERDTVTNATLLATFD